MENTISKKNTKQKIFEVSAELFAKKGYDGVSVREIAKEVGIKESSIYNHYKSKDEILNSLLDYFKQALNNYKPTEEEFNKMLEYMSPEDVFKNLIMSYGKKLDNSLDCIARIVYTEQFRNKRAKDLMLQVILKESSQFIEKLLNIMMEKKLIRKVNAEIVAEEYNYAFVTITFEYSHAVNSGEDTAPAVRKMFRHVEFICDYLKFRENN